MMSKNFLNEYNKLRSGSEVVSSLEGMNVGVFLAGGAITSVFTNKDINDYDLYFRDAESFAKFFGLWLDGDFGHAVVLSVTNKSITLHFPSEGTVVQAIYYKWFPYAEDIFDDFDFTVNMGAYCFKEELFVLHKDFLRHNAQRYLEVNTNTAFPLITALRIDKYKTKGYTISKANFLKVMFSVMKLNIKDWEDLKEHIGGMYGLKVAELFNTEKEFSVDEVIAQLSDSLINLGDKMSNGVDWSEVKEKVYPLLPSVIKEKVELIPDWALFSQGGTMFSKFKELLEESQELLSWEQVKEKAVELARTSRKQVMFKHINHEYRDCYQTYIADENGDLHWTAGGTVGGKLYPEREPHNSGKNFHIFSNKG